MTSRGRNCGTCDYWEPVGSVSPQEPGAILNGNCHIRSPQHGYFPNRTNYDWCGEYFPADVAAQPWKSPQAHVVNLQAPPGVGWVKFTPGDWKP